MTTDRDFDRIARAWLDMGPTEAPDRAIASALDTIEATPQIRRPLRWPFWRPTPMTRLPLLAALAGTIIVVAGLLLMSGGGPGPTPPAPIASATPAPVATDQAYASPRPVPTAIMGAWVGTSRGTAIEDPAVTHITFGVQATGIRPFFWIDRRTFEPLIPSAVSEVAPGELELRSNVVSAGCADDDLGRYRWSLSGDGQWLTLELVKDACDDRAKIVSGTWQRSHARGGPGGHGIAAAFTPYFTFSLPADTYTGYGLGQADTLVAETESYTFKLWKDLDGFVDPCDDGPGRIDLEGLDGFLGYLREDPRFDVIREEEFTIDGRRAVQVHFRVGDAIEPPCWNLDDDPADKTGVLVWAPQADIIRWNFAIGSDGALVVTEVDGVSLVFEPLILTGDSFEVDRETLDTIRFLDELPAPPES